MLLVAERGRSLGIVLMGAEQTASQVEERVVGNSALRVVGRLEAAESEHPAYGWLTGTMRRRSTLLQPGTMMVAQPEVPVPLVVRFPFPAWATRSSEVEG
ncbi:ATP-binding protein [bacterium]|nr:ATP-binding protein [bacterium]